MTDAEKKLIDRLNTLIEANANNPNFSNDSICLELGVSRSQLYRLLKEEFDLSTSLYIRKRKILKAKELIETSELKIAEVAYQIGMDSPQNLTKYFTQEYGISPTEYRKGLVLQTEQPKEAMLSTKEEPQSLSEQSVEKEAEEEVEEKIITEKITERIIEQKTTVEQKIIEAITERTISKVPKAEKPIQIVEVKMPKKKFANVLYFLGLGLLLLCSVFIWQMTDREVSKNTEKENSIQVSQNMLESSYQSNASQFLDNSIAILPFKNVGNAENSIFCDGVMEQIHSSLSQLENLKVISKTSSNQFRNTQKTIPQIANDLHVSYVLEGSVMQMDTKIRMSVQLVHAKDDRVVWAKTYDGDTKNVFAYMSAVAKEVADELNQKLSNTDSKRLEKMPTKNLEAYNEFLQAKALTENRSKEKLEASVLKFEKAIRLDSTFADAYAHLALAYFLLGDGKYIDHEESYKMTEQYAFAAIRLDKENAFAYANLANVYRNQNKWEQANTTYQIALKYNPNDALANYWYSLMLRTMGRVNEAIRYSSKAVELDPLYAVIMAGHIMNCIIGDRLDIAQKNIKNGELLFNEFWAYHWTRGYLYITQKNYMMALHELNKSHELNPNVRIIKHLIHFCMAKLGMEKEVHQYLQTLDDVPDNYTGFIIVHCGLGNKEQAMTYLQKAADLGHIPTDIKVYVCYEILWGDKRYEAILAKFGLDTPKQEQQ